MVAAPQLVYSALRRLDAATLRRPRAESVGAIRIYGSDANVTPGLERDFFAGIRLANGTFKTTADHRLDDVNEAILSHLPREKTLDIKDVAVSSGISTVELYDALRASHIPCRITATDLLIHARLVRRPGGLVVLLDAQGNILQIDVQGFAFRPEQIGRRERVLYAAPIADAARTARRASRRQLRSEQPVDLVTPRLSACQDIRTREEDLLARDTEQWDVIRAANVLNRVYFDESTLLLIIRNLGRSLNDEGILVICRTDPDLGNQASLFRRSGPALEALCKIGGGSEVHDLTVTSVLE